MINSGQALGKIASQERRIDAIIKRLEKTSHDAEELAAEYTSMRNRVLGEAPPDKETDGKPQPVSNGSLHRLEEIELRLNRSLNQLGNSLTELETAL